MLQVVRLDKKVECAACGSRAIEKREFEFMENGRMVRKERCLFCDKESGKLCSQSATVHGLASSPLSIKENAFST